MILLKSVKSEAEFIKVTRSIFARCLVVWTAPERRTALLLCILDMCVQKQLKYQNK